MIERYYKVNTSYCNYYAVVQEPYPETYRVMFGAKKKCVVFSVYAYDKEANIDALGHSEHCNTSGTLERGRGTQHMLKVAMGFIVNIFPFLSGKFIFKDTSYIECMNGYRLALATYEILNHGKTWYEKNFRAVPWTLREEYTESLKLFTSKVMKEKPPLSIKQSKIKKLYDESRDLSSFIASLKDYDCFLYKDWADLLIRKHVPYLFGMDWVIDLSLLDVPNIDITLVKEKPSELFSMQGGGPDPVLVACGTKDALLTY